MFPMNPVIKYESEKFVYDYLKENLSNKFNCYYNYYVKERETDFCILVPDFGYVIMEVKGWDGTDILTIEDNTKITYKNSNNEIQTDYSPLKQCRTYCNRLSDMIREKKNLSIFVSPVVCYPFMTEEIFYQKSLNLISPREVTLLKEDFKVPSRFLDILMNKISHINRGRTDKVNEQLFIELRSIFESEAEIKTDPNLTILKKEKPINFYYSKLFFLPKKHDISKVFEVITLAMDLWKNGVKIIVLSEKAGVNQILYEQMELDPRFKYLEKYPAFELYNNEKAQLLNRMFNFEIYEVEFNGQIEYFEVTDGQIEENECEELLRFFHENSDFNYDQYLVEHANYQRHILVSAGAGTGKTHSMISRVSYLIYKNQFNPESLTDSIYMITFTNEAANNMRKRLSEYFSNLFTLTENTYYLSMMEMVAKMKISTIHSLIKKIIQHYSVHLGFGTSISIQSGIYERREAIVKELNQLVESDDNYLSCAANFEKYELVKSVENLLDKFDKKNVDLSQEYNFGSVTGNMILFDLLMKTAQNVQVNTIEEDIEKNIVQLPNLMIYLKKLLSNLEKEKDISNPIKYLFIDEFQDTDDLQIETIKHFQKLFGFQLFVVGDIKQCIYRFRGAEDNAFNLLLDGMQNWEKEFSLTKNYRTFNELLLEFDKHFVELGKNEYLKYDKALKGVKISGSSHKLMNKVSFHDEFDFEKKLIEKLKVLEKGLSKNESIAILTRTNYEIEQIRQICKKQNMEVDTDMADNLYELESSIDLYKLVLALQFNNSPKYLYNLSLSNFSREISNRVVYANRQSPNYITQLFMENKIIPKWYEYVLDLKNVPVIRLIKKMISDIKPWNQYVHSLGLTDPHEISQRKKHYKKNMDLLLETIIKRTNDEYMTINKIRDFLNIMIFAKQHEDERPIEKGNNKKLLCTTIHKSKGLEYTHVILPFCDFELESINKNELIITKKDIGLQMKIGETSIYNDIFKNEKNMEKISKVKEEARILYVAMTRAEDTFTWFKSLENNNRNLKESWSKLLERGERNEAVSL
ncbi:UvrD-helicase domain-containing protein [Niallia taxi]|uniref:UvrD-helicase domain-containing protein n=1 Tax=Niallia taxi TaxID=2499688 RepID=UPI002E1C6FE0|nr:UvrD-helicase domain-containing protein [Niallia taxi]MED4057761.1 UvrD-helicase domain-containing protein [Niallia taxi]MED4122319.1 UvrD-helicase domain-containing protein [Niallia taxi]